MWIGCSKLSLLRREYLSSVVKVLKKSPKGKNITNRDIFQVSSTRNDQKYDKSAVMQIS